MAAQNPIDFNDFLTGEEVLKTAARSVRSLRKDVGDLSKTFTEDSARIKQGFTDIATAIKELQGKGVKLNLVSDADKKLLQEYIQQVGALKTQKLLLKETEAAQAATQRGLADVTKQYTSELAKQKDALRAAAAANDEEGKKRAAAAIRQITQETTQLSKALRGSNSELTAAKGSYDALVLQNNKLTASLRALGGGLDTTSDEAIRLQLQIEKNNEKLRVFDQALGLGYRNVGRYAESFESVVKELAKARVAQESYAQGSAAAAQGQMRIAGFQTAAQRAAAQAGLSYDQATAAIENQVQAIAPLVRSLDRLEKEQQQVAQSAGQETEAYRKIGFEIQQTKKKIDDVAAATAKVDDKSAGLTEQLGFTRAGLTQYAGQLAVGLIGLQALAAGVQQVVEANAVYSDQLADVRKTTGLTADEVERLADNLKGLDTRTSLSGLLDIAKVGGQLGIAKNDIFEFTKAVDVANQALSDDFKGGAEEIATDLGKIAGVFRKELGPDVAQNLLAIGSAVNELGAEGAATAPFLADVALRVGAVAAQSGVGLKNVLAYAAVLQETGFSAEVSGTALNRFFSVLSTRTKESFEIARKANPALTLKEFTNLVNTDFNGAIQAFLKGLRAGGKTTTELSGLLATLKLQSGEAKNAIITLSQNTDLFAQRQGTANTQLREATSLAEEAAIKNNTLAAELEKSKNALSELTTNGPIADGLRDFFRDLRLDIEYTAAGFGKIGQFITYLKEKLNIVKPPLEDFTKGLVSNTQSLNKQADAQQKLLDSYTALAAQAGRSGDQERELSQLRSQLQQQFGTAEAAAIQGSINRNRLRAESNIKSLQTELAGYDRSTEELKQKSAAYQDALTLRSATFTKEQIAQAQKIAAARLDGPKLSGKSTVPELEGLIATNLKLLQVERLLTTQQTNRGFVLEALRKLGIINNQVTQAATDATEEQAEAEETLDRAAQERAKNRAARLRDELSDNERRIADLKKYITEQGKLFEAGNLNNDQYAEAVRGGQLAIEQLERGGTAIRIQIARAEAAEKLKAAENDRIRQLNKKKITQAEITDIEGQFAARRVEIARQEGRDIAEAYRIQRERLRTERIEFIPPNAISGFQRDLKKLEDANARSYDKRLDDLNKYNAELQRKLENQTEAERAEIEKRRDLRAKELEIGVAFGNAYYTNRAQQLERFAEIEQANYEREIASAGENNELKEALEAEHQKKQAAIRRKQAENERQAAIFSILTNLAAAIVGEIRKYGMPFALPFIAADSTLAGIQLATLPPLPQYFVGREDGPAEFALVAERGPELIEDKKTGQFRYVAEQAVAYLNAGDKVHTAEKTRDIIAQAGRDAQNMRAPMEASRGLAVSAAVIQAGRDGGQRAKELQEIAKGINSLRSSFANMKQLTVNVGHDGSINGVSMRRNNSLLTYVNKRLGNLGG